MEAISNAGSCVGILAKDGVVLAAEKRITSKVRLRGGSAWLAGWLRRAFRCLHKLAAVCYGTQE
jgi:hypothetical protein